MYLNDLNSAAHNVVKINKILANTFGHNVDIAEMSTDSLGRMLTTTNAKIVQIKESDLTYWDNPTYNKLNLISHSLTTYIKEVAPARADGKALKAKIKESAELEQAEVLLAAQELVDELQKMVEDLAEMQVQKLMPIVDAMKEQMGFDQAEAYNAAAEAALAGLLAQAKDAKGQLENATLTARGEAPAQAAPTDMGMEPEVMDAPDMGDEFTGDGAAAGEDNALGRELKGESAISSMEKDALAEKKFLESKGKLLKMVESGDISYDQFNNILSEFDANNPKPRDWRNDGSALRSGGMGPTTAIGSDGSRYASRTPGVAQVKARLAARQPGVPSAPRPTPPSTAKEGSKANATA